MTAQSARGNRRVPILLGAAALLWLIQAHAGYINNFKVSTGAEMVSQLKALWGDKPEYEALITPRPNRLSFLSGAPPSVSHAWVDQTELIRVSFVVGLDGRVEDARVLDTTNHRLNSLCLKTIGQRTFAPPRGSSGPEKAMGLENFWFRSKR
jgi:hypothetical protein